MGVRRTSSTVILCGAELAPIRLSTVLRSPKEAFWTQVPNTKQPLEESFFIEQGSE